jgi:hypothetical protein
LPTLNERLPETANDPEELVHGRSLAPAIMGAATATWRQCKRCSLRSEAQIVRRGEGLAGWTTPSLAESSWFTVRRDAARGCGSWERLPVTPQ